MQHLTSTEYRDPSSLKPHPLNAEIYGDGADSDLVESIRKKGVMEPILITKENLIISGHRRRNAAEIIELKAIPVSVVEFEDPLDEQEDDISINELDRGTRKWDLVDSLTSEVRSGNYNYIIVQKYYERTGISLGCCISMLAGKSASSVSKHESFKNGKYELGDPGHAETVADIIMCCKENGVQWASNSQFVKALSKVVWVKEFDERAFKAKIKKYHQFIQKNPMFLNIPR